MGESLNEEWSILLNCPVNMSVRDCLDIENSPSGSLHQSLGPELGKSRETKLSTSKQTLNRFVASSFCSWL